MIIHRNTIVWTLNWLRKLTRVSPTSNRRHAVFTVDGHYMNRDCSLFNHPVKDSIVAYTAVTTSHRLTGEAIAGRVNVELQHEFWIFYQSIALWKNESWTREPPELGGPLDFVHPCPMVVTPLDSMATLTNLYAALISAYLTCFSIPLRGTSVTLYYNYYNFIMVYWYGSTAFDAYIWTRCLLFQVMVFLFMIHISSSSSSSMPSSSRWSGCLTHFRSRIVYAVANA